MYVAHQVLYYGMNLLKIGVARIKVHLLAVFKTKCTKKIPVHRSSRDQPWSNKQQYYSLLVQWFDTFRGKYWVDAFCAIWKTLFSEDKSYRLERTGILFLLLPELRKETPPKKIEVCYYSNSDLVTQIFLTFSRQPNLPRNCNWIIERRFHCCEFVKHKNRYVL